MATGCIQEIKNGGIKGCLGLDQIDMGGGNEIYAVWKVAPCCGSPDIMGILKCAVHWWVCGCCATIKLFSKSLGNECNLIPSCLFVTLCPCSPVVLRYNLRKKKGAAGNCIGDIICCTVLGPCAACQTLRAASVSDWELWPIPAIQVMAPSLAVIR